MTPLALLVVAPAMTLKTFGRISLTVHLVLDKIVASMRHLMTGFIGMLQAWFKFFFTPMTVCAVRLFVTGTADLGSIGAGVLVDFIPPLIMIERFYGFAA